MFIAGIGGDWRKVEAMQRDGWENEAGE